MSIDEALRTADPAAEPGSSRPDDRAPAGAGQGATILLLDEAQARRFEAEGPEAARIVALTPGAASALGPAARERMLADPMTDFSHARVTARARRAARQFKTALDGDRTLCDGTKHWLNMSLEVQAYLIGRVWETLRVPGPWLLPQGEGWRRFEDRDEAHVAFLEYLRDRYPLREPRPLASPLLQFLTRLVLLIIRGRGPWVVSPRLNLVFGLDKVVYARPEPIRVLSLETRHYGPQDYIDLLTALRQAFKKVPAVKLPIAGHAKDADSELVIRALEAIQDPIVAQGITAEDRAVFMTETAYCQGLYDESLKVVRLARPRCFVSRQNSGRFGIIADAAGKAGVTRLALNQNSFPPTDSAVANHMLKFFFNTRMPEALGDRFHMWSPHLAALSRDVYSERGRAETYPLRLEPAPFEEDRRAEGPYRVLHASNSTEWMYFFPWIMETSNEFLDGILSLEAEVAKLPEVELTVRTKPKSECNPEALRRLLPPDSDCKVTGMETPFTEAVRQADLLVGFASTTIEETILQRRPVLLWGPTKRYMQLPGRETPPTAEDRSAVYVAHRREDLGPMLMAILKAHAGKPLTDAEIAPHVWPEGTPGLPELAESIATGEPVR